MRIYARAPSSTRRGMGVLWCSTSIFPHLLLRAPHLRLRLIPVGYVGCASLSLIKDSLDGRETGSAASPSLAAAESPSLLLFQSGKRGLLAVQPQGTGVLGAPGGLSHSGVQPPGLGGGGVRYRRPRTGPLPRCSSRPRRLSRRAEFSADEPLLLALSVHRRWVLPRSSALRCCLGSSRLGDLLLSFHGKLGSPAASRSAARCRRCLFDHLLLLSFLV